MRAVELFRVLSVADVRKLLDALPVPSRRVEEVPLLRAAGRVLARGVRAPEDVPAFSRSTVDGYAVIARETFGAGESTPTLLEVVGEVRMGEIPRRRLEEGEAMYVPTGGMLPEGADAVVAVEHVEVMGTLLNVYRAVSPGQNVIFRGEDALAGEDVLGPGMRLRAYEIAYLAGLGVREVPVYVPPTVTVFSTGDELVPHETRDLRLGQVRDTNAPAICLLAEEFGARVRCGGIVRDDEDDFARAIGGALQDSDLVVLSGGSSVGVRDLTLRVLEERFGAEVFFHGISLHPGKPTLLARVGERFVLGLPGNPTSATVVFFLFGRHLLARLAGEAVFAPIALEAKLRRPLASVAGRTDYYRVRLVREADGWWAEPVLGKSGLLFTLLGSDGLAEVPEEKEGYLAGESARVYLLHTRQVAAPPSRKPREGLAARWMEKEE